MVMSEHEFDVEITRSGRRAADQAALAAAADRDVWHSAAEVLGERVYPTEAGAVRLRVEWPPYGEEPVVRLRVGVSDEREQQDARDLPAFLEVFFHEAFLLFNIAAPGSFGGVVAVSGGEYRVHEIALDARLFETAWVAAARDGGPVILPLAGVVAWYDSLGIGTRQIATDVVPRMLFHLLHLARGSEDEMMTIVRLADGHPLREALIRGTAPVVHPMHDETLDAKVEEIDWTEDADVAASAAVAELQARARDFRSDAS